MERGKRSRSRRRLTITAKALEQAENVALWHSTPHNGIPLQKAVNGFSGAMAWPRRHATEAGVIPAPKDHESVEGAPEKGRPTGTRSLRPNSLPTGHAKARKDEMAAMKERIAKLEAILNARRAQSGIVQS